MATAQQVTVKINAKKLKQQLHIAMIKVGLEGLHFDDFKDTSHVLRLCADDLEGGPTQGVVKHARANWLRRLATALED